MEQE
jgi:mitogen-activated protein kinase kinase kinase